MVRARDGNEPRTLAVASVLGESSAGLGDNGHVLRAGALGSLADREFDLLAFAQIFVADILERRHVEEDFFTIARDESKALVRKFLDCSLSHVGPPSV